MAKSWERIASSNGPGTYRTWLKVFNVQKSYGMLEKS